MSPAAEALLAGKYPEIVATIKIPMVRRSHAADVDFFSQPGSTLDRQIESFLITCIKKVFIMQRRCT